ncbi:hypothetical protein IE53DRAFT_82069 [Violaceomyces palustris]|uniref:Uncharacterized protein n=1 Tax=Violaceomyces palustris TaxID=1673888 RepID=A0ACD0NYB2_9BASI|nr:hypothetical protein IE53DRAFT_82069 [Violaceomyces palustris]
MGTIQKVGNPEVETLLSFALSLQVQASTKPPFSTKSLLLLQKPLHVLPKVRILGCLQREVGNDDQVGLELALVLLIREWDTPSQGVPAILSENGSESFFFHPNFSHFQDPRFSIPEERVFRGGQGSHFRGQSLWSGANKQKPRRASSRSHRIRSSNLRIRLVHLRSLVSRIPPRLL